MVSVVAAVFGAVSTPGGARAAYLSNHWGGTTLGGGGVIRTGEGMVVGGDCPGGVTLGGGSALGSCRGDRSGGCGDETATLGHATINPFGDFGGDTR